MQHTPQRLQITFNPFRQKAAISKNVKDT